MPWFRKTYANGSSGHIKLSKTQLFKIGQSGELLGRLLGPSLKTGLPLMKNALKLLAISVLTPLRIKSSSVSNRSSYSIKNFQI